MIDPGRLAGRTEQLQQGYALLNQAAAGEVRHAVVTGPRGIGKSSLVYAIRGMAEGNVGYLDLVDMPRIRPFVVGSHSALAGQEPVELAEALLSDLQRSVGSVTGFEVLEAEIHAPFASIKVGRHGPRVDDVVVAFVNSIEKVWAAVRDSAPGIVLTLDELDRIARQEGVATFLRAATEMLWLRRNRNVLIICAGIEGAMEALLEEHASIGRVFDPIDLPVLSDPEVDDLVRSALQLASPPVSIDDDAMRDLMTAAAGDPSKVQAIGFDAFRADTDYALGVDDIAQGIARLH